MAQVSYGTITVSDLTDITDVYLQYCMAADTYATAAAIEAKTTWITPEVNWFTLSNDTTVNSNKIYYELDNNIYFIVHPSGSENPKSNNWYEDSVYPTWQSGYQIWVRQVTIKEGINQPEYGTPYLDKAVNQINNSINQINNTFDTKLKYFWINQINSQAYPAGTYTASGNNVPFNAEDSSTYGYNTYYGNGIQLRYNALNLATLTGDALTFYQPPTISETTTVEGNPTMVLSGNALTFYNPNDGVTAAATLNSTGLNIAEGSITLGDNFSVNSAGSMIAKDGQIGGWNISDSALHTNNKNSWDDAERGIYIGTYAEDSFVISGGINLENQGDDESDNIPYWYIRDDGAVRFGAMTLTTDGKLSVPAASVTGSLTAAQIDVNDLGALSANIGSTVGHGGLSNTLNVNLEKKYVVSLDTRINPSKTYYRLVINDEQEKYQIIEDISDLNENPSSMYKLTRDTEVSYTNPAIPIQKTETSTIDTGLSENISQYFTNIYNGNNNTFIYIPTTEGDISEIVSINYIITGENLSSEIRSNINFDYVYQDSKIQDSNGNDILVKRRDGEDLETLTVQNGFLITITPKQDFFLDVIARIGTNVPINIRAEIIYHTDPRIKQYYEKRVVEQSGANETYYIPIAFLENASIDSINPKESNYYELEYWYEKIDSSYIRLESNKDIYVLTTDNAIENNKNYYKYTISYNTTIDEEVNELKDYYVVDIYDKYSKTEDTEVIDNKDYFSKIEDEYEYKKIYIETYNKNINPTSEGWYEIDNNNGYKLTEDTQINLENLFKKVYYQRYEKYRIIKDEEKTEETNPKNKGWFEFQNITNNRKVIIFTNGVHPKEREWYEQIISYTPVSNEDKANTSNPSAAYWYEKENSYNVKLSLQDAILSIQSNERELLSVKSEEDDDINIFEMEVRDKLKIGKLEIISFNNGIAIRPGGNI